MPISLRAGLAVFLTMTLLAQPPKQDFSTLIATLTDPRDLRTSEHVKEGDIWMWVGTDPKSGAAVALAELGDPRAVPALEAALKVPEPGMLGVNVAYSLYLLTGKAYPYLGPDGKTVTFAPSPLLQEQWRARARPDLIPVEGLTAKLETDHASIWPASKGLRVTVSLKNQGSRAVELDLAASRFALSWTSVERRTIPATALSPIPTGVVRLAPGASVSRTWTIEKLATSPFGLGWTTQGVYLRCEYATPGGKVLISNSIEGFYFELE